jgi:hypothetical protein
VVWPRQNRAKWCQQNWQRKQCASPGKWHRVLSYFTYVHGEQISDGKKRKTKTKQNKTKYKVKLHLIKGQECTVWHI